MEVNCQLDAPTALLPEKNYLTHLYMHIRTLVDPSFVQSNCYIKLACIKIKFGR
jgi:hypothetical protein